MITIVKAEKVNGHRYDLIDAVGQFATEKDLECHRKRVAEQYHTTTTEIFFLWTTGDAKDCQPKPKLT